MKSTEILSKALNLCRLHLVTFAKMMKTWDLLLPMILVFTEVSLVCFVSHFCDMKIFLLSIFFLGRNKHSCVYFLLFMQIFIINYVGLLKWYILLSLSKPKIISRRIWESSVKVQLDGKKGKRNFKHLRNTDEATNGTLKLFSSSNWNARLVLHC